MLNPRVVDERHCAAEAREAKAKANAEEAERAGHAEEGRGKAVVGPGRSAQDAAARCGAHRTTQGISAFD